MQNEDWVTWLAIANVAMIAAVLIVGVILAYAIVSELLSKRRRLHGAANDDEELRVILHEGFAHSLPVPELGMTMADGGERTKPSPEKATEKKPS